MLNSPNSANLAIIARFARKLIAVQGLDVVEIDAASNRGIDEIRNLKESVRLSPTSFPKRFLLLTNAIC